VPALVRDKTGEIVYGLQAKDFIIEDNGVAQTVHLDEAAEAEPVSLVVAVQCGRRADYELPRMHGLGLMLQPLMAQPETKVAIVAFDSQVHAIEDFTGNENVVTRDLEGLQAGDGGAAILDAVNYSIKLLDGVPKNRKRVLLLISETRDHGSHSATIDDVIKALGNSNIVVYTLAFSPSKSNLLDTLRGNNNPDLHPEQTEMHEGPDLLAPLLLAAQAMRKNSAKAIASLSGGEYEMFDSAKGFRRAYDRLRQSPAQPLSAELSAHATASRPAPVERASEGTAGRDRPGPQQLLGTRTAAVNVNCHYERPRSARGICFLPSLAKAGPSLRSG